ncbi:hypothetical protein [Flavobacterium sp. MDT1-60]|uniref:hypothetical protein n=1 Tax=Flavobacterium sp. MDT1-60 TaxID=1979344 RepID=UPI00177B8149|nr:hypothetical protein [Flavobacterium sp. MDT1-60]QOG03327.1 hypothetical protein IHE43_03535 [Flavobacterium sp. MDT1-60]
MKLFLKYRTIETEIQRSMLKRIKEEAKNISSLSNRYFVFSLMADKKLKNHLVLFCGEK